LVGVETAARNEHGIEVKVLKWGRLNGARLGTEQCLSFHEMW
jgi:hypothetical protein